MKTQVWFTNALALILVFTLFSCSEKEDNTPSPLGRIDFETVSIDHSMKGWEIFSWPSGKDWTYSVLPGKNSGNTYESVIGNPLLVVGKDSLKMLLDKFPEQEYLFWVGEERVEICWGGNYENISLPDERIIREIRDYCAERNLILMIDE